MNKTILIGNLTRDPELRETPNGVPVCNFSIAVQRDFANSDGEKVADYFNIIVWRAQGESCHKYLKKGRKVAVVGSLQTRNYEDSEGIKRTAIEVIASEVEFLTPKQEEPQEQVVSMTRERPQLEEIEDNQLPF